MKKLKKLGFDAPEPGGRHFYPDMDEETIQYVVETTFSLL
jgi:hypothetical protein